MVKTRSTLSLQIVNLTPMQIAETLPQDELAAVLMPNLATEPQTLNSQLLVVYPGEPNEMVVQVKNLGSRSLTLNFNVGGDFPLEWCQYATEGYEILPHSHMSVPLYFVIPTQFFEQQDALHPQRDTRLKLKYQVTITAQTDAGTDREQTERAKFSLYVRPRSLYLTFLPALYREVDFIGRFLKIFEQAFEPLFQSLEVMWAHLDPLTAPEALLPFLSHWVGWQHDPLWDVKQQRRLIRQAVELYRWRGTRKGLRLYLHWFTGLPLDDAVSLELEKHISITEPFGAAFVLSDATLGEGAVLGGGQAYHFSVHLRFDAEYPADRFIRFDDDHPQGYLDENLIRKILNQEKPAFCTYDLSISTPHDL
jgi:phage tail-like protein